MLQPFRRKGHGRVQPLRFEPVRVEVEQFIPIDVLMFRQFLDPRPGPTPEQSLECARSRPAGKLLRAPEPHAAKLGAVGLQIGGQHVALAAP